jgi:hypothetical protein
LTKKELLKFLEVIDFRVNETIVNKMPDKTKFEEIKKND